MVEIGTTKSELTLEEQRLLSTFWTYCQPIDLYKTLADRFDKNVSLTSPTPPPPRSPPPSMARVSHCSATHYHLPTEAATAAT